MLRHLDSLLMVGSLGLCAVACAAPSGDDTLASSDSSLTNHDQAGIDAQVLEVWTPGRLFPRAPQPFDMQPRDVSIDADTQCTTLETSSWSHWQNRTVDCTAAFAATIPLLATNAPGPVMTPVRFTVSKEMNGGQILVDPDFCNHVEIHVAVREAATSQPSFAGVGFWTSRGETFTPKDQLQEADRAVLANGEAAIVYRFSGLSTCVSSAHDSTSGNTYQTFSFKPYAAYDAAPEGGGEAKRYRVWENIRGNHTIGRSRPGAQPVIDATGFVRTSELLAP